MQVSTTKKWLALAAGTFGMAICSSTFFVWQSALRQTLQQTELQSNLMYVLGSLGFFIAFPAGIVYEKYGPRLISILGCFINAITYLVLGLGVDYDNFPTLNSALSYYSGIVYFLWFCNGFACSFIYMASLMTNVDNFSKQARAKVIGFLDGACALGPALLSVVYNLWFVDDYVGYEPAMDQVNLHGFFYLLAILNLVIGILLFFFNRKLAKSSTNDGEIRPLIEAADGSTFEMVDSEERRKNLSLNYSAQVRNLKAELSFRRIILEPNFHLLFLQFGLACCSQLTFQSNITTYLESLGYDAFGLLFTVLITCLQAASNIGAGVLSDWVDGHTVLPRSALFIVPYICQTFSFFVSIWYGDWFWALLLTSLVTGLSYGITYTQTPVILGELFGSKFMASNYGWMMLFNGLLSSPFSLGFSAIYQAAIYQPDEIWCYSLACFQWSYVLFAGASFAALLAAIGLTHNTVKHL